jgi:hypothetical protein
MVTTSTAKPANQDTAVRRGMNKVLGSVAIVSTGVALVSLLRTPTSQISNSETFALASAVAFAATGTLVLSKLLRWVEHVELESPEQAEPKAQGRMVERARELGLTARGY